MIVKKRGEYSTLKQFTDQRLRELKPRTHRIPDLAKAIDILKPFIKENKKVYVFGDYDVDGVMSTTILVLGLREYIKKVKSKSEVIFRIPKRKSEGFGLNSKMVDEVEDGSVIITCDNGIAAIEPIKKAKARGLTVILTDHHLRVESGELPPADIIIDPNAIEGQAQFNSYCGAGLAYKFIEELFDGKCDDRYKAFASVATIADVVPLVDENWEIGQALPSVPYSNAGLGMLSEKFNISEFDEGKAGFQICPAINAVGRLLDDGAQNAVNLLLADDKETREGYINLLYNCNELRKALCDEYAEEAFSIADSMGDVSPLVIYGNYNLGVVGIIAGKLAEKYKVPAFVFGPAVDANGKQILDEEGNVLIKGSGRTAGDNDLKYILDSSSKYIYRYGGHKGAAGVTLRLNELEDFIKETAKYVISNEEADTIYYDLEMSSDDMLNEIIRAVEDKKVCAPYGECNEEPRFLVRDLPLNPENIRIMGKNQQHIKFMNKEYDVLAFDFAKEYESTGKPEMVNAIVLPSKNVFLGKERYQLEIIKIINII